MARAKRQTEPERIEPLTDDRPLWTGFRAQLAAARAMANDGEAEHLRLEQCLAMVSLARKDAEVPGLALLKQLELSGVRCELPLHCALFLVNIFRSTLQNADALIRAEIATMAAPAEEPGPLRIPDDERALELTDEPFELTETAMRMQKQG